MKPFDPFTSPFVRPSWHKKIKLYAAPKETRIWNRTLDGTGKCCCFTGWNNAKDEPYGIVRVNGQRWYLHRYAFSKYHGIEFQAGDVVDHICRRRLCFNPLHLECTTHRENYDRGDGRAMLIQNAPSDEEIQELLG